MKEVVRVSISGIAFTFEQDAYEVMKDYISRLESGYAKNPDGREIVADIEARIAELILNEQDSEKVVDLSSVQSVVAQLGYPDDMSSEEPPVERIPKRLYRNRDGALFGGVCSGLGTYFRIDTVWVRLIFFLPLLLSAMDKFNIILPSNNFFGSLFGMFVLLYIVLWISVPMARTPRQKLEMRGERITASSIRNAFEEENPENSSPKRRKSASVWADVVYSLGRILQFFIKAFIFIVALVVGICAIGVLIGLFALLFTGDIIGSWSLLDSFDGMVGITPVLYIALLCLAALIPLFLICYFLLKLLFGSKANRNFMLIFALIWIALAIYLSVVTAYNSKNITNVVQKAVYTTSPYMDLDLEVDDDGNVTMHSKALPDSVKINGVMYQEYLDDLDDENVRVKIQPLPSGDSVIVSKIVLNPANMKDTMRVESIMVDKKTVELVKNMPKAKEILKSINF